jgi:cytochrome b
MAPSVARTLLWPWWQRLSHWALAGCVLLALITHEGGKLHEASGYGALIAAAFRIALGLLGPHELRFASFARGWRETLAYGRKVWLRCEPRYLNHNPLGAWMVVVLLVLALLGALTGWLYTTNRFWGVAWVIKLHALLTWPFVVLVIVHIVGVVHASIRQRENLVAAMLHGYKRIDNNTELEERSK